MRPALAGLVAVLLVLSGCEGEPTAPEPAPGSVRTTASGQVIGFADRFDTFTWRAIPYAAPPVGDLRWRAPQPAAPWQGTREALDWAAWCPQFPIPMVADTDEPWLGDEDCLYLNVSAPRTWQASDEPLPVMVWIHGGGNSLGSADLYSSVRNLAAQQDVVVVSIQYRLGLLGWFNHPALREQAADALDASGNFGTLDTIAALQWVRDNIAAFGGDPGNVTIFGESAGGINVFALLLSPLADGLFHRAISQSGILMTATMDSADGVEAEQVNPNSSRAVLERLLLADGKAASASAASQLVADWDAREVMAYLRGKGPGELLQQVQGQFMGMYPAAQLLRDGLVIPDVEPLEALAAGAFNRVPIIAGTNRDEIKLMMMRDPNFTQPLFGVLPRVKDTALYDRVTGYGSDMWKVVGADEPAAAILASGHEDIYVYRFDWDEPGGSFLIDLDTLLGAAHGLEIPFVFRDLDGEMSFMPFAVINDDNRDAAAPLADAMSAYWGRFARDGAPGGTPTWEPWDEDGAFLVFDVPDQGGIRMAQGEIHRHQVFTRLAGDAPALGGADRLCTAYTTLFGAEAIFGFTALCPEGEPCAGAAENFCPQPGR
jgi:para-nitrobenzyl esterase